MQIWAGLGNPGPTYAMHRHNIGFMVIDALGEVLGLPAPAKKFRGWVQEARIGGDKIILLKPATFMNESGRSIRAAMDFYKLSPADVTVFYDELDLMPFKVKVKRGGGAAGHNGIRSTIDHIGADFRRVRLGIGHPGHKDRVTGYVLGNFHKSEIDDLADLLGAVAAEADWLAKGDDVRFMNDVAMRQNEDD
jgi:peptidyl-tRNA hydrolase, PTH1 family